MIRSLVLLFAITSAACSPQRAPDHPKPAPTVIVRNLACEHAKTIGKSAQCLVEMKGQPTTIGADGSPVVKPDVAIVDFGKALAYCWSGEGIAAGCGMIANFNPPPKEEAAAPASPAATPEPPKDAKAKAAAPKPHDPGTVKAPKK